MKVNGQVLFVLHDCLSAAVQTADPKLTRDQAWVMGKKILDVIQSHPTLKVTQVGTRKPKGEQAITTELQNVTKETA
jgi:hypothetical protein